MIGGTLILSFMRPNLASASEIIATGTERVCSFDTAVSQTYAYLAAFGLRIAAIDIASSALRPE